MGLYDTMKEVVGLVQKHNDVELTNKILELQTAALAEQEDKAELQGKIEELERVLDVSDRLVFRNNRYALRSNAEGETEGDYCSSCWDTYRRLSRLHVRSANRDCFQCPVCKTRVKDVHLYN